MPRALLASSLPVRTTPFPVITSPRAQQINIDAPAEGAIGGAAQKVGGPLAKDGMVGKQFTEEGNIGGTVQDAMGGHKRQHG